MATYFCHINEDTEPNQDAVNDKKCLIKSIIKSLNLTLVLVTAGCVQSSDHNYVRINFTTSIKIQN